MKKFLILNWKKTQNHESAQDLLAVVEDVAMLYNEYQCILMPGDDLIPFFITETDIELGTQDFYDNLHTRYCLLGHMSRRLAGETDEIIREKLGKIVSTHTTPILCVGPLEPTDTLKDILEKQLAILDLWPLDREIVISYEPAFSIGNGQTMSLEDISIIYQILAKMLKPLTQKSIIYGGSVNAGNIAQIVEQTDGVIVGTASQEKMSLLSLFISLGEHD